MTKKDRRDWTEADIVAGYQFGVDGILTLAEAEEFLGVSDTTLDRMWKAGSIRKAKVRGRVIYCKRSIMNYLANCEV